MVKTPSTMLPLGTPAPDFMLADVVSGHRVSLGDFGGQKGLLVMFICAHCPYVKHVETQLASIGDDYIPQGVAVVAISSNDIETHPDDSPAHLKAQAESVGFEFPYLFDEGQVLKVEHLQGEVQT